MTDIKAERNRRWVFVGLWVSLIYSTLYIVRPVCEFLKQYLWFAPLVNIFIIFLFFVLVVFSVKQQYVQKKSSYFLLLLVFAGYLGGMKWLSIPEERLHFIEYGILAFLVYRALTLDLRDRWSFLWAFVITSLVGLGDEAIQYLLPNRYYQFKDVCLNSASAVLGLVFVYILIRDKKRDLQGKAS